MKKLALIIFLFILSCQSLTVRNHNDYFLAPKELNIVVYVDCFKFDNELTSFITEEEIIKEIEFVNEVYKPLHLSLRLKELIFSVPEKDFIDLGKERDSELVIVYGLPKIKEDMLIFGLGLLPPMNGIYVNSLVHNKYTLAHEIGHFLGLEHVFQEGGDNCEDTPFQEAPDPNGINIMDYSKKDSGLLFTPCQIGIMWKTMKEDRRKFWNFVSQTQEGFKDEECK